MKIESIEQEYLTEPAEAPLGSDPILCTEVIISEVASPCILSRLMINALGRPGIDTDMELMSGGDRCIICWTQPQLSLDAVKAKLERAIYQ
jgi:hypothetical protein